MFGILVWIARIGDSRQRNCKTRTLPGRKPARGVRQVATEAADQRARDVESKAGRFGAGLKRLEEAIRRGDAGSRIFNVHRYSRAFDRRAYGKNFRG